MIGAYLKWKRNSLEERLTSEQISQRLDITASFYRMIESGATPLSGSKMIDIIEVLGLERVLWSSFSKLLIAQQVLENCKKSLEELKNGLERLSLDRDLRKLLSVLNPSSSYWEILVSGESSMNLRDYFNDLSLLTRIDDFLTNPYFTESKGDSLALKLITNRIGEIPATNFRGLSQIIDSLGRPSLHLPKIAEKWETDNKDNLQELIGFYQDPDFIINKDNLSTFSYDYLFRQEFERIRMVFISSTKEATLKNSFIEQILLGRKGLTEKEIETLKKLLIKKVQFKTISLDDISEKTNSLMERLQDIRYTFLDRPNCIWVFKELSGIFTGFAALLTKMEKTGKHPIIHIDYCTDLTIDDGDDTYDCFNELWDLI